MSDQNDGLPPGYVPPPATAAAPSTIEEKQDMHITEPRQPDRNWMPPIQITVSAAQRNAPYQLVAIKNTSLEQRHIVTDRLNRPHEFEPGQMREGIEMLVSEIEYFLRERSPNRFDAYGHRKPIHPIEIIGLGPIEQASAVIAAAESRQAPPPLQYDKAPAA